MPPVLGCVRVYTLYTNTGIASPQIVFVHVKLITRPRGGFPSPTFEHLLGKEITKRLALLSSGDVSFNGNAKSKPGGWRRVRVQTSMRQTSTGTAWVLICLSKVQRTPVELDEKDATD